MITINLNQQTLLALFVSSILVTIITFSVAAWQWRSDWQLVHQSNREATTVKMNDDTNQMILNIPEQHLFGKSLPQGSVPVTNLQMQITGIVLSSKTSNASKVYISIAGQPSKIYHTGDTLPYGVKVYKITPDTVIFDNDGRLEKLSLAREKLEFKPTLATGSSLHA
jgi:type II secretory pathway component PulC